MVSHITDEVSCDSGILLFEDEKLRARFELGVSCAVFLWDDLAVAVDNMWGGPESAEKREWMAASVVELFESPSVAVEDIEYRLLSIMEDEFDTTIDTETAMETARTVLELYAQLRDHNYKLCDELYERWQKKPKGPIKAIIKEENDDDDDDDDDDEDEDEDMEVEDQEPAKPKKEEPVIDEDGFQVVSRKRR